MPQSTHVPQPSIWFRPFAKKLGSSTRSLVVDGELVNDVEVLDHDAEFVKGDLSVEVGIGLHNRPVDQLLQLHVVQVVAYHHLEDLEQLTVGDEAVVVNVVNLERKSQLILGGGSRRERVQTLHELQEGDVSVVVAIKHCNDTLDERVVGELRDLEELRGLEGATLISVDLAEVLVQLLQLTLREVKVLELVLLLGHLVSHLAIFSPKK